MAGALALTGVVVAWQVLVTTGSVQAVDPAGASVITGSARQTAGMLRFAQENIAAPEGSRDWGKVREAATAVLANKPLESDALTALGLAQEGEGDSAGASRTIQTAGERSLRNTPAHLWLFVAAINEKRYEDAIGHIDVSLRLSSDLRSEVKNGLLTMTADPEGAAALARHLAQDPPWRTWLLNTLGREKGFDNALQGIYASLNQSSTPVREDELRSYLNRLLNERNYPQAYLAWRSFAPGGTQNDRRYLSNGDFTQRLGTLPFDWKIERFPNYEITLERSPDNARNRLRIQFGIGRIATRYISKLVVLPPGDYTFAGASESRELRLKSGGLAWTLTCLGNGPDLAASPVTTATTARAAFSVPFTVPATNCPAQILRLEAYPRPGSDTVANWGNAYYDSLRIDRVTAASN